MTARIFLFVEHIGSAHGNHIVQISRIAHRAMPFIPAGKNNHTALSLTALGFGAMNGIVNHRILCGSAPTIT